MRATEFIVESEKQNAIEKIRKLSNTEGRTDAEKATAESLIQRLIEKYKIRQEEIRERKRSRLQQKIDQAQSEKNLAWALLVAEVKRLLGIRVNESSMSSDDSAYEAAWELTSQPAPAAPNQFQPLRINEALDSAPYPYYKVQRSIINVLQNIDNGEYWFKTNDNLKYEVSVADFVNGISILFGLIMGDKPTYKIQDTGNARRVFATVIEIAKKEIKRRKPNYIFFTADEPSRIRLYDAFIKRLDKELPSYEIKPDTRPGVYILTRKKGKTGVNEAVIKLGSKDTTRSKQFVDMVNSTLPINPMQHHYRTMLFDKNGELVLKPNENYAGAVGLVNVEVEVNRSMNNTVEVKWIGATPLGSGYGTKAMQKLQEWAREYQVDLTLYAWNKGRVSQATLVKIYRKMGFKPTSKGSKSMIWMHSTNK